MGWPIFVARRFDEEGERGALLCWAQAKSRGLVVGGVGETNFNVGSPLEAFGTESSLDRYREGFLVSAAPLRTMITLEEYRYRSLVKDLLGDPT